MTVKNVAVIIAVLLLTLIAMSATLNAISQLAGVAECQNMKSN